MIYPTDLPVKIVMLGAGGTGAYIAPNLYRLLYVLDRPSRFIICDGDIVERKNLRRQNFAPVDLGENKARVIAERYSQAFGMETEYIPGFIEDLKELTELVTPRRWALDPNAPYRQVTEMVILIGAVDNNKSRRLCHEAFMQANDLIYIDSGNSEFTGQVVCGVRKGGRTVRKPVAALFPEMLEDTDKFPSELSCAEAAMSDPQSMAANLTAATAVTTIVYNILTHGENLARQVDFSTRTVRMQTVLERQRRKAA